MQINIARIDNQTGFENLAPGLRLTSVDRKGEVYKRLQKSLSAANNYNITASAIRLPDKSQHRLYRIELPDTPRNRRVVSRKLNTELEILNNKEKTTCFVVWTPVTKGFHKSHDFKTRLKNHGTAPNYFNHGFTYMDLTDEDFFSIDSPGVRKDGKAVYADIDDAFNVKRIKDGFNVRVAFADITWLSRLSSNDNIFNNAVSLGYSLYGTHDTLPMLGKQAEAMCSLLEGYDRYVWIIEFDVSKKRIINLQGAKVYRAKIRNRMQMDYNTSAEETYTPELAENLRDIRAVAKILEAGDSSTAAKFYKLKSETANAKAVAQLMIHSRNLLAVYFRDSGYPAIYRVQYLSTSRKDLEHIKSVLNNFYCDIDETVFTNPLALAQLLTILLSSKKAKDRQAGINISDYLLGKSCYSCSPSSHDLCGFHPYSELKGLRKLTGFVNQHVLDTISRGVPAGELVPIITNLCKLANKRRSEIHELQAYWHEQNKIRRKAIARHGKKQARWN